MNNASSIVIFSLSGFNATVNYRVTLFTLTLLSYCVILVVNVTLILTIILDKNLHEPMYICVCNLCFNENELYGTAGFFPKFAFELLSDVHVISYVGCLLQIYAIYSYTMVHYVVLALMAYDRYVAICRPLEYHSVMSLRRTAVLVALSWLVPFCCMIIGVFLTSTLKICGSHIEKIYCENWAVVKLACSSTKANDIYGLFLICIFIVVGLSIPASYVQLVKSALKSRRGRRKFTQTCVPHLLCLFNVSVAGFFDGMYSRYGSASLAQSVKNFMAIQFLLIPPMLDPIIYGLILTKIRGRMKSLCMMACQKN
uniref:LOW QUALITY PROTEIN: olfactory receptor 1-like n=1 Tax=Monopterus albus TaxID=43700 RepID=UPI0009B4D71E|nr:LOW QUALITY PROTEIN: olfactory receptor 1-like [Monopterus albus]